VIEIIGEAGTSEHSAAIRIADGLVRLWPGVRTSNSSRELIRIVANAKVSGYGVADIDIIVAGALSGDARPFIPSHAVNVRGALPTQRAISVRNFVVAIEVKDHDASGVRITGDAVQVRYAKHGSITWSSATQQNIDQVHALKNYLRDFLAGAEPYVFRCLVMQGLSSISIAGAVAQAFDGADFMTAVASVNGVALGGDGPYLASTTPAQARELLNAPVFRLLVPSGLDRRRMDALVAGAPAADELFQNLGKRMVCLRGPGGTGKTVMMLHAAWRSFQELGNRTLVLTYNRALAADIRRLMCLLKIPSAAELGGVTVVTVMRFISGWLRALGVTAAPEDDDGEASSYSADCVAALDALSGGALNEKDFERVMYARPDSYLFDAVLVDEAQDWPQAEVDLLKAIYGAKRICFGDGIEQMIRSYRPPDWRAGVDTADLLVLPLQRCLRMKRNLALFANALSDRIGEPASTMPNESAGGGRVIVLKYGYSQDWSLHEELVRAAKAKGNDEVDFLHCVPTSDVESESGHRRSRLGQAFLRENFSIWDGTNEFTRNDFPRGKDQLRIVHYGSCRGLEGWTVVMHNADEFWEECRSVRHREGLSETERLAYADLESITTGYAWQRLRIAMTRPIDTLVITLADPDCEASRLILRTVDSCKDFAEARDLPTEH
jgi:hypothetical protein